jgi:hypothetical protein
LQFVDIFVYEIGREEKDLEKRKKIDGLKLTPEEWGQVKCFLDLLAVKLFCIISDLLFIWTAACRQSPTGILI